VTCAIVEQQRHPLVPKASDQAGKGILSADFSTEHSCNRARRRRRSPRAQIDQPDAVFATGDHALGDGEGDRSLTDPAGSDDRHQKRDESRETSAATESSRPIILHYRERQIVHPASASVRRSGACGAP
jgi:hypothetical protein